MQLLNKRWAIIIFFFFFIELSYALELGASPSTLNINIEPKKVSCQRINLFSSSSIKNINVYDYWSKKESKNVNDFIYDKSTLNIDMSYVEDFELNENKRFDFCIIPKNEGRYFGVILFEVEDSNIVMGVWINLIVGETNEGSNSLNKITGLATFSNYSTNSIYLQLIFSFILMLVLFYMLIKLKS